jgi:hypothetical protein
VGAVDETVDGSYCCVDLKGGEGEGGVDVGDEKEHMIKSWEEGFEKHLG